MKQKTWVLKIVFLFFTAILVYYSIVSGLAVQLFGSLTALVLLISGPIILLIISFRNAYKITEQNDNISSHAKR